VSARPKTAHFAAWEFRSPGVPKRSERVDVPRKYWANLRRLMRALEVVRAQLGDKPFTVASGYRTPAKVVHRSRFTCPRRLPMLS